MTGRFDRLLRHATHLPDFQLGILARIAERLHLGVERYGVEFQRRDTKREAMEESLDAAIYLAAGIERMPDGNS